MRALQFHALVLDTLREANARKVGVGLALNSILSVGLLAWYLQTLTATGPYSTLTALRQSDPRFYDMAWLGRGMLAHISQLTFSSQVVFTLFTLLALLPPLLDPARNAVLVALPVSRRMILLSRLAGCALLAFGGIGLTYLAVWIVAGMRFQSWHVPFLAGVGTTLLAVLSLLGVLLLFQLAVDSTPVAFLLTAGLGALNVASGNPAVVEQITGSGTAAGITARLGCILPRISEISHWTATYVGTGATAGASSLWITALFGIFAGSLATFLFSRKNF